MPKMNSSFIYAADFSQAVTMRAEGGAALSTSGGLVSFTESGVALDPLSVPYWENDQIPSEALSVVINVTEIDGVTGSGVTFVTTFATDIATDVGHGLVTGDGPFQLTTTDTLPAPLATATDYWAIRIDDDEFQFATSEANALATTEITLTDDGTGTHSYVGNVSYEFLVESGEDTVFTTPVVQAVTPNIATLGIGFYTLVLDVDTLQKLDPDAAFLRIISRHSAIGGTSTQQYAAFLSPIVSAHMS